jgi:DNA-binding NarL/FixJ family response regulator
LLASVGDFEVVGEASDGRAALVLAGEVRPDVAVVDISLPEVDGIEVTRALKDAAPDCRVLILSMHGDEDNVSAAFAEGARGYVVKDEAGRELIQAIRAVAQGELHVSPRATEALVQSVRGRAAQAQGGPGRPGTLAPGGRAGADAPAGAGERADGSAAGRVERARALLSPREGEVLKLVAGGMSTKEVAHRLQISPKTADAHRQAIMRKLDIHDVAGLVRYALREGYIELT